MCAARTFHDLLVLQTGGYICMQQQADYGDMRIRLG
jgi:hypothetical protein